MSAIKEYNAIDAGIAKLALDFAIVPDCSTISGLDQCKKDYRTIRKVEIALENKRLELGVDARAKLELISTEAKEIDGRIKVISAPFKEAAEKRQDEITQADIDRKLKIQTRLDDLSIFATEAEGLDSEGVSALIEAVNLIDIDEKNFDEFLAEGLKAKRLALDKLTDILQRKVVDENMIAERKANAITERINNLKMIPVEFMGIDAGFIDAKIESLSAFKVTELTFGGRVDEVNDILATVIAQLKSMLGQQILVEEAATDRLAAKLAEDAAAIEEEFDADVRVITESSLTITDEASKGIDAHNNTPTEVWVDEAAEISDATVVKVNNLCSARKELTTRDLFAVKAFARWVAKSNPGYANDIHQMVNDYTCDHDVVESDD